MATLTFASHGPADASADALIVGLTKGESGPELLSAPGLDALEQAFEGGLTRVLAALGATGAEGEITRVPTFGRLAAPVVVAVGAGKPATASSPDKLGRAAGAGVRALAGTRSAALAFPTEDADRIRAVAEGALLGAYAFTRFRTVRADLKAPVESLTLLGIEESGSTQAARDRAAVVAPAVHLARDLVNTPPSHLHPQQLAEAAVAAGQEAGLSVEVLDEQALADGGYGGILGVGKGALDQPRLVVLTYSPAGAERHLALVGKGITFDSGGLSLKPPQAMETMKCDMGGAAAVIAAASAVAKLRLPIRVTAYAALAENMPSGTAQRPSDVLTTRSGKTVEVLNTDAEGRLVLADALTDAVAENPDLIIDVATLTGAQMVALGNRVGGLMSNFDEVADAVHDAANRAGESMWPMPLPPEMRKSLDSQVADIANIGDRMGGMLSAGIFLKEFVGDDIPWAHLDIAGPAFNDGEPWGYTPKQGTGAAVRTLVQVAEELSDGRFTLPERGDKA